jgi:hypothetical protein
VAFVVFAAVMISVLGVFHAIAGLVALLANDFYVVRNGYELEIDKDDLELDPADWRRPRRSDGCVSVYRKHTCMLAAILIALASAIWSFYSIPYYPVGRS